MSGYKKLRYVENGKIVPNKGDSQKTVDKWQKSYDSFKEKQSANIMRDMLKQDKKNQ